MSTMSSLELRTKVTSEARLELWLEQVTVPKPAADEVVVRIDAAPLNPLGFAAQGVHIAVLTIGTGIAPESKNAEAVGEAFWRLHAQPRDQWVWEASYG
jgi:NADPH:quinone reductase-like Zn-dependent oxidoreductase